MDIRINNILDLQLVNDDVSTFVNVFGVLKTAIEKQGEKVGFKKNGTITIELSEDQLEFVMSVCENIGIVSDVDSSDTEVDKL